MQPNLQKLIDLAGKEVVFDAAHYPELEGSSEEERLRFAIRHSALHFAKTAGKIAAVSEDADHGEKIDIEKLKGQMLKSLVNLLWLADKVGMREDEFISGIEKKYGKSISS